LITSITKNNNKNTLYFCEILSHEILAVFHLCLKLIDSQMTSLGMTQSLFLTSDVCLIFPCLTQKCEATRQAADFPKEGHRYPQRFIWEKLFWEYGMQIFLKKSVYIYTYIYTYIYVYGNICFIGNFSST
jgi:hypothetical protein